MAKVGLEPTLLLRAGFTDRRHYLCEPLRRLSIADSFVSTKTRQGDLLVLTITSLCTRLSVDEYLRGIVFVCVLCNWIVFHNILLETKLVRSMRFELIPYSGSRPDASTNWATNAYLVDTVTFEVTINSL